MTIIFVWFLFFIVSAWEITDWSSFLITLIRYHQVVPSKSWSRIWKTCYQSIISERYHHFLKIKLKKETLSFYIVNKVTWRNLIPFIVSESSNLLSKFGVNDSQSIIDAITIFVEGFSTKFVFRSSEEKMKADRFAKTFIQKVKLFLSLLCFKFYNLTVKLIVFSLSSSWKCKWLFFFKICFKNILF